MATLVNVPVPGDHPGSGDRQSDRTKAFKQTKAPEHKYELIQLTPIVKERLRNIIRTLQSKKYELHLKRQYKRAARARKEFRRSEIIRQQKEAEKVALTKLKENSKSMGEGKRSKKAGGQLDPTKSVAKKKPSKSSSPISKTGKKNVVLLFWNKTKWRENKYRKWRKLKLRSHFMRREMKAREQRRLHPGTRPYFRLDFGRSYQDEQIDELRKQRVSARWHNILYPRPHALLFSPMPKVSPAMERMKIPRPNSTKKRFRRMLKTEWEVMNHDRLNKNRIFKAMAQLILNAKELYDKKQSKLLSVDREVPSMEAAPQKGTLVTVKPTDMTLSISRTMDLGGPTKKPSLKTPELSLGEVTQKKLKEKIIDLLRSDPQVIHHEMKRSFMKEIQQNGEIRKNDYINRPKTTYDSFLRRKIQGQVIGKYLYQRHLIRQEEPRMPLPFRRVLVGFQRPQKLILSHAKLIDPALRLGPKPTAPLLSILSKPRTKIKKLRRKRPKYPSMKDPHNPEKVLKKEKKMMKNGKEKGRKGVNETKSKSKVAPTGLGNKSQVRKTPPPKDPKMWKRWHRKQKRERRKRKLRKWIKGIERRRRVKIAQEILDEEEHKGKRNLGAMRKKIRQLEEQVTRAKALVHYYQKRTEFLTERHKDLHERAVSDYQSKHASWKELCEIWFKLKDYMDEINLKIKKQTEEFFANCIKLKQETVEIEETLGLEVTNLETDYMQIVNFVKIEPYWEEEIDRMERQKLFYEYLFEFKQSAEVSSMTYMCDLLQRIIHRDFMNMAYQERRTMRRQLPRACKRMLDERSLLAQEENKIRLWCNRLQRKQDKHVAPMTAKLQTEAMELRRQKAIFVKKHQELLVQSCVYKKRLKKLRYVQPRILDNMVSKEQRKLEKSELMLRKEEGTFEDLSKTAEILERTVVGLQGLINRDNHKRALNCEIIMTAAVQLRKAFGLPEDFFEKIWFIRKKSPDEINTFLKTAIDILLTAPCMKESEGLNNTNKPIGILR